MKLYGGKFLRNSMERATDRRIESRDAILYDIDPGTRRARVRIQGSATLIVVYYPENWEQTPVWLKPGNAVKISHTGGNRSRLELVGHGALIPTPVEGDTGIPSFFLPDAILSGLNLIPVNATIPVHRGTVPWEVVLVTRGSFRLDEETYTLPPIKLGNPCWIMGHRGTMGQIGGAVDLTDHVGTPFDRMFKYNDIYISANLNLSIGDSEVFPFSEPLPHHPPIPAGVLRLGWVTKDRRLDSFYYTPPDECPQDYIYAGAINKNIVTSKVPKLIMKVADSDLSISELSTSVVVYVVDENGRSYPPEDPTIQWQIRLSIDRQSNVFNSNRGQVKTGGGTASSVSVTGQAVTDTAVFSYQRNGTNNDLSVFLIAQLVGFSGHITTIVLVYDSTGALRPID